MTGILIAVAVVAGVGIVIGILLGVAGEKFKVEVDEKEIAVRELLPGNNCGGCGYPGCDGQNHSKILTGEADERRYHQPPRDPMVPRPYGQNPAPDGNRDPQRGLCFTNSGCAHPAFQSEPGN